MRWVSGAEMSLCYLDVVLRGIALWYGVFCLVLAKLDVDTFWARYFFRVHQVEKDEERRKALLASTFIIALHTFNLF